MAEHDGSVVGQAEPGGPSSRDAQRIVNQVLWEAWRAKTSGLLQYYLFMLLRVISLGGSATVPVLAYFGTEKLITTWVAAAVFLSEVLIRVIDPGAHALNQIKKADELRSLVWRYQHGLKSFSKPDGGGFSDFAANVDKVRNENLSNEWTVLSKTFAVNSLDAPGTRSSTVESGA